MKVIVKSLVLVLVTIGFFSVVRAADEPAATAAANPNDPASPHAPGVYHYSEAGGVKKMTKIDPVTFGKTKQNFAFFGLYGQQTKTKAVIEGGHAPLQLADDRPVFYFYFGSTATGLGEETNTDPEEYVLTSMDVKDKGKSRRLVIGKAGWYGGKSAAADKKANKGVIFTKAGPGVYKAVPAAPLADGEYCLFRPTVYASAIFDFAVKTGKPEKKRK